MGKTSPAVGDEDFIPSPELQTEEEFDLLNNDSMTDLHLNIMTNISSSAIKCGSSEDEPWCRLLPTHPASSDWREIS